MRYLLDPRSGQIRGKFSVDWDFDLEGDDDNLIFKFDETDEMPTLDVEGSQFYIDFANIASTGMVPLLEDAFVPFNKFTRFCVPEDESIFDDRKLLDVAEKIGPLFGSYDDSSGLVDVDAIREPLSCWCDAARTLNFAIRAHAWLSGRGDSARLDDEIYYLLYTGRGERNYWECVKFFARDLGTPYSEMLLLPEEERARLLLPARDASVPDFTFLLRWEPSSDTRFGHPWLSVAGIPEGMDTQTVPVAYVSHRYMTSTESGEAAARALLAQLVRSLVLLHTGRVYHDLHDGFFGVAYNSLLEHLWYSFATDAALGKLGVCEHCGRVFEAMAERKDRKRFCSTDCQEYAKSARNYRKRKIRETVLRERRNDVSYLLHVLNDPKITALMVKDVLGEPWVVDLLVSEPKGL